MATPSNSALKALQVEYKSLEGKLKVQLQFLC